MRINMQNDFTQQNSKAILGNMVKKPCFYQSNFHDHPTKWFYPMTIELGKLSLTILNRVERRLKR